jgi:hypothetical protein
LGFAGTKEALAVRLRKLAIDGEETLRVAELAYQQSFQVQCFRRLSTALTGPPEPISVQSAFIGAPESDRLP